MQKNDARVTITKIPDRPGIAGELFSAVSKEGINVDMITQTTGKDKKNSISFTIGIKDLKKAQKIMKQEIAKLGGEVTYDDSIAIVSIVGVGMRQHSGIAGTMFNALAKDKINIEMISTSEISISAVIAKKEVDKAVKAMHKAFKLDKLKR